MKVWIFFIIYHILKHSSLCSTNINMVNEKGIKSHNGYILERTHTEAGDVQSTII